MIELTGPADTGFVGTARLVAVAISSDAGMVVDACDELCLALEAACDALQLAGAASLMLTFVVDDQIAVTVRPSTPQGLTVAPANRVVMSTLTDGFDIDTNDGAIRLLKQLT